MSAPVAIPLIAPASVERFQNNARSTTGPKAEPKPAHASETSPIILELGLMAITKPIIATTTTATLPMLRALFSVEFFLTPL